MNANTYEVRDTNVIDIETMVDSSDGYLITLSILKKGSIEHSLITKNFPLLDFLPSISKAKELVLKELEEAGTSK
jgi:hypothetical protein